MSPCATGKQEGSSPPRQGQESESENQRNVTLNHNVDTTSPNQSHRRSRRSCKRKAISPNRPAKLEKRSKFLERNRIAASKCRQKKREWIVGLHNKARELQVNKECLSTLANSLKEETHSLKSELLEHSSCGFPLIEVYIQSQIDNNSGRVCMCSHYRQNITKDESSR